MEKPEDRDAATFKVADLRGWLTQERPRLVAAVLTLLRAWIEAGAPMWSGRPIGSFENWSLVIGGILETIGVPGFLGNRTELYERADPEREKWRAFFAVWHARHAEKPVGVGDVADLASECDVISEDTRGARNALGRMIRGKCDRHFRGTQTHLRRHEPPGRTIPGEIK
jgi:hypothetical protein